MQLTDRDRRTLIIGGAILGVLIVGYLLMNVVFGGGDDTTTALPTISAEPIPSPESPTPTPTSGSPVINFTGRDPFSIPGALAVSTTSPGSPTVTVSGTTTITITPSPTTSPTTSTSPSPTTTPTVPGGGSSTTIGGHTVVLLDTFIGGGGGEVAQVEVDGRVYSVSEGDIFAQGKFKVVSISGDCATFLFGDERFTLCSTSPK